MDAHPYAGIPANQNIKTIGDAKVRTYEEADAFLDGANMAQLASNVRLFRHEDYISLVLYNTEVVRYYPDETFSVDNGGFNTPTTRQRITQFTPDSYIFWHEKKQLTGPGGVCTHSVRLPVNRVVGD